ncbi:MAG: D-aminoacyl-tRNA deacylase [Actinobacteria bacterium]|nr:D-aminoacyl-tRNA deacylase [Actinomycetota bacterium]
MRAVIQRVSEADVSVEGEMIAAIGAGLVVLVGVATEDTEQDAMTLATKLVGLRIFPDDDRKMNRSIVDVGGSMLLISQFTLLADLRKGRRPAFNGAAPPEIAEPLLATFAAAIEAEGVEVEQGRFGAMMDVSLTNDGPVTIVIDVVDGKVV